MEGRQIPLPRVTTLSLPALRGQWGLASGSSSSPPLWPGWFGLPPLKQLARLSSFPWTGLRPAIVDSPGPIGLGPYRRTPLPLCVPYCKVLLVPGGGLAGGWALAREGSNPSPSARISLDKAAPHCLYSPSCREPSFSETEGTNIHRPACREGVFSETRMPERLREHRKSRGLIVPDQASFA